MTSAKHNAIANQFVINDGGLEYFQSYKTIIAKRYVETGTIKLDENYWDYSVTTSRYRNQFLGMDTKEIKAAIKSGMIELENLNQ